MDRITMQNILMELRESVKAVGLTDVSSNMLLDVAGRIYNSEMITESRNQPNVNANPQKVYAKNAEIADYPATDKQKSFAKSLKIEFAPTISKNELSALIHAKTGD